MSLRALVIHEDDNVCNLIGPGDKRAEVDCEVAGSAHESITLLDDIPSNHKFARSDIAKGVTILKYGLSIGKASEDIKKGAYVHAHNVESNYGRGDLR